MDQELENPDGIHAHTHTFLREHNPLKFANVTLFKMDRHGQKSTGHPFTVTLVNTGETITARSFCTNPIGKHRGYTGTVLFQWCLCRSSLAFDLCLMDQLHLLLTLLPQAAAWIYGLERSLCFAPGHPWVWIQMTENQHGMKKREVTLDELAHHIP